jgi:SAM-dependent methyltransferase
MEFLDSCPICGNNNTEFYIKNFDYLVSKEEFYVVKCKKCGFLFTNPRPFEKELGNYYLSNDYISHTDSKRKLMDVVYHQVRKLMLKKKFTFIVSHLPSNVKSCRLMDYGCGTGEFLIHARSKKFDVLGVEPSINARNRAVAKGLDVVPNLDSLKEKRQKIHVVTLWHVLEHIPDPKIILKELMTYLEKDGLIVVAVPEYLSFDSKFYKNEWAAWDLPRHLNHFDENTVTKLFQLFGFKLRAIYPLVFDSFYVSILSEKNKNGGYVGVARAFIIGLISNLKAKFGNSAYSSQVYVFSKQ